MLLTDFWQDTPRQWEEWQMTDYKQYRRTQVAEMRLYGHGDDLETACAQIGDYRSAKNYFRDGTYPDWLRRGDNFEAVQ